MKRLIIAAAVAAMIGSTQAATCVDSKCANGAGSAYKVAISLKTASFNGSKKKNKKCNECDPQTYNCTYWREQTTQKINGLLWAQLPDCANCYLDIANQGFKSAFWTKDTALPIDDFAIGVGLIGKGKYNKAQDYYESNKIQAYGGLSGADFGELAWAGFGSADGKKGSDCANCLMYVKSITGGIAGQLFPVSYGDTNMYFLNVDPYDDIGCGYVTYGGCCDDMQLANSAAYGTIKITYDKSTAKKVAVAAEPDVLTSFYKVPAAAAADIDDVVSDVTIEE